MTEAHPTFVKFSVQRADAKRRGIEFLLTFEEWSSWWLEDDRWSTRGRGKGKLVMARYGDTGPYALGNIHPATHAENMRESAGDKRSAAIRQFHSKRLADGIAPVLAARGAAHPQARAVNTPAGRFESGALAGDHFKVSRNTIYNWINGRKPGFSWAIASPEQR